MENSPSSYFPSSLCDGTPRKALTEQRTWCYESRGNSQAMVFCHLYKHRVFRKKKNNVTIQPLLPSRRRTPCWSGSQVVWFLGIPTSPSLLWAEVLAERCNPGREGQSQEPGTNLCNSWAVSASPARRGEQSSSPGQHQLLNAVINEASRRGFNDS